MTEKQWQMSGGPQRMLRFLRHNADGRRKMRLFAVACVRRIDHLLSTNGRKAVIAAEDFADGRISVAKLNAARAAVGFPKALPRQYAAYAARAAAFPPDHVVTHAAASAIDAVTQVEPRSKASEKSEKVAQADLLRDIFNPFRPVLFEPIWRTPQAVALARTAYDERQFEDLPLLADALEEAGCTDEAILAHCRGLGPHVRGCWVVDLILGKA